MLVITWGRLQTAEANVLVSSTLEFKANDMSLVVLASVLALRLVVLVRPETFHVVIGIGAVVDRWEVVVRVPGTRWSCTRTTMMVGRRP